MNVCSQSVAVKANPLNPQITQSIRSLHGERIVSLSYTTHGFLLKQLDSPRLTWVSLIKIPLGRISRTVNLPPEMLGIITNIVK